MWSEIIHEHFFVLFCCVWVSNFFNFHIVYKKLVHVVRDFRPWRKYVIFWRLELILRGGWTWSGDFPKILIYLNFDPMGCSRAQKLKIKHIKIRYFRHYVPWTKIPDNMNKSSVKHSYLVLLKNLNFKLGL